MVKKTAESLPRATERALIQVLLDKEQRAVKFKSVCDKRTDLFGTPGSELRVRVQKRREYLRNSNTALRFAVNEAFPETKLQELASPSVKSERSEFRSPSLDLASTSSPPTPRFSSPPPRRKNMAHLRGDDDDSVDGDTETFTLDIEKPWRNPFGIMVIKGTEVEEENTVVDKLTIMKPIFDSKDFEDKLYKGRLCNDGGGIIVTEPTIPGYLWQHPKEIQLLVDEEDFVEKVCQPTFRTYKTHRTDMKKNVKTHTKEVIYRFPRGVTCNNEFFNKQNRRSSQLELDTEMVIKQDEIGEDSEGTVLYQFLPFLVWRVAIDGAGKQTADEDEDVSAASKAFARLGIKKRGTNPNAMSG
jgi:hypothetical protein